MYAQKINANGERSVERVITPDASSVSPPNSLARMKDVVAVGVARRMIPGRASRGGIA